MALPVSSMRLIIVLVLVFGMLASHEATARTLPDTSTMVERHEAWMTQFGRTYKDEAEKAKRLEIFKENVEYIESFNEAGTRPYKLAVNKFADMTIEEFRASHTGFKIPSSPSKKASSFRYENVTEVPTSIDWREKGAVTRVKEDNCGSSWIFPVVAAVEGIHALATGELVSLSEQEVIDCDGWGDQGCIGGFYDGDPFWFIKKNGLTSESNYPYTGKYQKCNTKKMKPIIAKISGAEDVPENNESALQNTVANQPVCVAVDAGNSGWIFYKDGVLTEDQCGTNLNHGVTVVGYGEMKKGTKYWLAKNTWGADWGDNGYIKLQRDVEAEEGTCGIAMWAAYPVA